MKSAPLTLSGSIEPTRLSLAYRSGLAVVALAMLLLPVIYLALIAATAAAVWWHITHNVSLVSLSSSAQFRLLAYATPAVVGVVLVFFLIKPILARPSKPHQPVPILPDAEPALFAFIQQICRQVRAPIPRRVQVDCQVNASASFMPGPYGVLKNELVLTIGLPLVAGLSVRDFGGVLAHEFGHFAQGGGLRLTMIVRSINHWFARVVYQRDKWDEQLAEWTKESDWRISIVLVLATGAIWVSRKVLNGLMLAGHAISCYMMRQMEYDADSYEVKFAGSEAFVRTSVRLREMSVAAHFGYQDLRDAIRTRTAPENLPAFMMNRLGRLPDEVLTQIRQAAASPTSVFDTHPSDADRVRAAEATPTAGILVGGEEPATGLFRDFETLAAAATRHHYEHDLNIPLSSVTLVDTTRAVGETQTREARHRAIGEFFSGRVSIVRPLQVPIDEVDQLDSMAIGLELVRARDAMAATHPLVEKYRRVEVMEARRDTAYAAEELLTAGMNIEDSSGNFEVAEPTVACAISTREWADGQIGAVVADLDTFEAHAVRRLACGVCLSARASSEDALTLARTFNIVSSVIPHVRAFRHYLLPAVMLHQSPAVLTEGPAKNRLAILGIRLSECRTKLSDGLSGVPCPPWLHAEDMDLATWCGLAKEPESQDASDLQERVVGLYQDLLGRLTAVAIEGESSLMGS